MTSVLWVLARMATACVCLALLSLLVSRKIDALIVLALLNLV
jgi:hypothetical protein